MTEMSEENAVLGIGEVLLKAREAKQQPLTDISALLKIRRHKMIHSISKYFHKPDFLR